MLGKRVWGVLGFLTLVAGLGLVTGAHAQTVVGQPHDWQMGFGPAYTPVMEKVAWLHNLLLVIITLISIFVLALLIIVVSLLQSEKFRARVAGFWQREGRSA